MPYIDNIIKSQKLSAYPEIIHGVSTKKNLSAHGAKDSYLMNNMSKFVGDEIEKVMKNRAEFYEELGINNNAEFAHANQVHSGKATVVHSGGLYSQTDALITNHRSVFLVISIADCLPVMLYDRTKKVVANIHSGWRGTVRKISISAIEIMVREFNCNAADITAFIGPGISCENFEVGSEVAVQFGKSYIKSPGEMQKSGKYYIDLKAVVRDQLKEAGVKDENIDICPFCTYEEKDMLHSYRRDNNRSGRMFAVIGLK